MVDRRSKAKINKFADVSPALIIVTQRERKFHVTDRQARECRRNEGRRRKVEELLQAGWPSPQILIFWFTGSCPSFLGSCPPHHPASFIPHTFLSLFLYFIANNNPLLVNLTFLSDRYPRVYPDLSSLPVCWSFNTTAVALRN